MNARKAKAIRKKSYQVLYDWIRFECLSEEERNTMKPVVDSEVKERYDDNDTITNSLLSSKDFTLISLDFEVGTTKDKGFS